MGDGRRRHPARGHGREAAAKRDLLCAIMQGYTVVRVTPQGPVQMIGVRADGSWIGVQPPGSDTPLGRKLP